MGSSDSFNLSASSKEQVRARGTSPLDLGIAPIPAADPAGAAPGLDLPALDREIQQASQIIEMLRPRVTALHRAIQATEAEGEAIAKLFNGASEQERMYTIQVAKLLATQADPMRKARIAVQQYEGAVAALKAAQEVHARLLINREDCGALADFQMGKFKGAIYPLYNFGIGFQGMPLLAQMFPLMKSPTSAHGTQPLNRTADSRATQPLTAPENPLGKLGRFVNEHRDLANLPVVDQGLSLLRRAQQGFMARVTGSLRRDETAPDSENELG